MTIEPSSVRTSPGATVDAALIAALKRAVPRVMKICRTPGLAVAVGRHSEVIWKAGFGYSDIAVRSPMSADALTKSGSMGKTYTATAIMQLVEQGVLGLHDPVEQHAAEIRMVNPFGTRPVTIYDLLTHRSGLAQNDAAHAAFSPPPALRDHLISAFSDNRSEMYYRSLGPRWIAAPGELMQYSNLGLAVLGYLVEKTNPDGLSFSAYVEQRIMAPLGMASSSFPPVQDPAHLPTRTESRMMPGYALIGDTHVRSPEIYFADYPAGTAVISAPDHLELLLAYLNQGRRRDVELLKPESVALMLSPHVTELSETDRRMRGPDAAMGLVWWVTRYGEADGYFHHTGSHMYGWANLARAYPGLDLAIVIATNHWLIHDDPASLNCYPEGELLADYAARWLRFERPGHRRGGTDLPWGWRAGYLVGLTMAERLTGALGDPVRLDAKAIYDVCRTARPRGKWSDDGFRAGVQDLLATDLTASGIARFLESDALQVPPAELWLLYRELGGTTGSPVLSSLPDGQTLARTATPTVRTSANHEEAWS
jgi:CubicO group peptidase (beta-lactamase class C family)